MQSLADRTDGEMVFQERNVVVALAFWQFSGLLFCQAACLFFANDVITVRAGTGFVPRWTPSRGGGDESAKIAMANVVPLLYIVGFISLFVLALYLCVQKVDFLLVSLSQSEITITVALGLMYTTFLGIDLVVNSTVSPPLSWPLSCRLLTRGV